ncbi:hypothetical protein HFP15_23490 [Amycolatopsis sp. K13G38]|uniref:Uncharacterized protein n=1 Tax=Amycolatopsis acididurans TaxID=2724524 RepID=A0ABX1J852_9PSEU|nr:hypothetical protein [Amycolatopsis acididurans]NKQ55844.1 hypothetical protein [Amycolatopsis acididurans]
MSGVDFRVRERNRGDGQWGPGWSCQHLDASHRLGLAQRSEPDHCLTASEAQSEFRHVNSGRSTDPRVKAVSLPITAPSVESVYWPAPDDKGNVVGCATAQLGGVVVQVFSYSPAQLDEGPGPKLTPSDLGLRDKSG